jgi:hypothetical protein
MEIWSLRGQKQVRVPARNSSDGLCKVPEACQGAWRQSQGRGLHVFHDVPMNGTWFLHCSALQDALNMWKTSRVRMHLSQFWLSSIKQTASCENSVAGRFWKTLMTRRERNEGSGSRGLSWQSHSRPGTCCEHLRGCAVETHTSWPRAPGISKAQDLTWFTGQAFLELEQFPFHVHKNWRETELAVFGMLRALQVRPIKRVRATPFFMVRTSFAVQSIFSAASLCEMRILGERPADTRAHAHMDIQTDINTYIKVFKKVSLHRRGPQMRCWLQVLYFEYEVPGQLSHLGPMSGRSWS